MLKCPACESPHDDMFGLFVHMRNSKDEKHARFDSTETVEKALAEGLEVKESSNANDERQDTDMSTQTEKDPSSMFDEPTTGETVTQEVELPCGHESVNPDDIPQGKEVICEVCGHRFGIET